MAEEVATPPEGQAASGARSATAVGTKIITHGRVEEPGVNDGPPLGHLHGEVKPLPKDS
jgi:hypothetical protein